MFWAVVVVAIAGAGAALASYVMWRAVSRSGLCSLIAGLAFGLVAFGCAILMGLTMTRVPGSQVRRHPAQSLNPPNRGENSVPSNPDTALALITSRRRRLFIASRRVCCVRRSWCGHLGG